MEILEILQLYKLDDLYKFQNLFSIYINCDKFQLKVMRIFIDEWFSKFRHLEFILPLKKLYFIKGDGSFKFLYIVDILFQ